MTPANISDTERREIARKLRKCTPPTSYRQAEGGGWAHLCDMAFVVGFKLADNPTAWEFAQRLADLIEPSCDRDALLDEVKELKKCAWYFGLDFDEDEPLRDRLKEASEDFAGCARRIREACGEVVR